MSAGTAAAASGPSCGDDFQHSQAHLTVFFLTEQLDQNRQRLPLHALAGAAERHCGAPASVHVLRSQTLDNCAGALGFRPVLGRCDGRERTAEGREQKCPSQGANPQGGTSGEERNEFRSTARPSQGANPQGGTSGEERNEFRSTARPSQGANPQGGTCCEKRNKFRSTNPHCGTPRHASRPGSGSVLSPKRSTGTLRLLQHGQQQVGHRRLRPAFQVTAPFAGCRRLCRAR